MRFFSVPIFILFLLLSVAAPAQLNNRFTSYTANDGLPQSSIWGITCDKEGFLWAGTSDGLCRFDGYNFRVYKHIPGDTNSISGNKEHKFYVDKAGRLWLVGYNGISLYNPIKDNFNNVITYRNPYMIGDNCIYGEDDNFIWAGLCGYGLVKINKRTLKSAIVNLPVTADMQDNYASFKGFIGNGKIWACRYHKLFIYNAADGGIKGITAECLNVINMNDSEALGVNHETALLINKTTLTCRVITLNSDGKKIDITFLYRTSDTSAIVCSATRGLLYLNTRTGKITRQISIAGLAGESKPLHASCVYADHSGNLWIGTNGQGLQKMARPFKNFKLYTVPPGRSVTSLYASGSMLYAGCYSTGLDVFNRQEGFVKNIAVNNNQTTLLNNVFAIGPYVNGKLMMTGSSAVTSHNNLLFTCTLPAGILLVANKNSEYMLPGYWYKATNRQFITPCPDGSLLTGVGEYLISITGGQPGPLTVKMLHCFKNEGLDICFYNKGTLIAGTTKGGWLLQPNGWVKANLPPGTEVKTISADNTGNIWFGTTDGIFVTDSTNSLLHHFTEQNGLVNEHIYGILKDDEGNMWFSHNKGLSVYRQKKKTFQHFTADDGLQAAEFNGGAYCKSADGELFFGGINGVTSFYPGDIRDNPNAPIAKITGIKLFDEPYKTDTAYWGMHSITLPYSDNSLSFDFTALEFTNPAKNSFSYIMQGLDKNWINAGNGRFVRYAGMQPGNYTFMVKAANNDGVWGRPVSLLVNIVPPFWDRLWFRILYWALFAGAAAAAAAYLQRRKYKKLLAELAQQQKLQSERERISRDLHDNVGTQLSLINRNIEDILNPPKIYTEEEKNRKFQSARQRSSEVIDTLRETIWALNKKEINLEEFADQLKAFVHKQIEPYDNLDVQFTEHENNCKMVLGPAEVLNLFRICQEAVTNTIKYAGASSLVISVHAPGGKYCITIADNGEGFDPGLVKNNGHYGLENMQYRASEISCMLSIETKPGFGTTVTLCKI